jgi:glycogen synthase
VNSHPQPAIHRIMMTADPLGGVWTYALELARALQEYKVEIVLATMGAPPTAQQRAEAQRIGNVRLLDSCYKLEWMENPWEDIAVAGTWLLELEALTQPDVVHLNGYVHGALPWQSPTLIVGHSCVFSWFAAVRGGKPPAEWERYQCGVVRGLRSVDLVTAPTEAMLAALKTRYGPFAAAPAIYNGRSAADFAPGVKAPFVFTAGRVWDAAKNVAALEQVAPQLSWPVYVAGEDCHPDGGEVGFAAMQRLGWLEPAALAKWLARAAIFALPARYEPFGLLPLEAGLAGCALVLGDIPSLREVWGDAALFVAPDQPAALEAALRTLIRNAPFRDRIAKRARARALQYTPERMARAYMALYAQLMRTRTPQ